MKSFLNPSYRKFSAFFKGRLPSFLQYGLFLWPLAAGAAEFTLIETAVTHTASANGEAGFNPLAESPADWSSPDNYLGGTAHFQLEITDKPSEASISYIICAEQGNTSACTDEFFTHTNGYHQWSQPIGDWTGMEAIDWSGSVTISLAVRDCDGNVINPNNNNWCGAPLIGIYFPMQANFTAIMVSEGSTFSGWDVTGLRPHPVRNRKLQILSSKDLDGAMEIVVINDMSPLAPARAELFDVRGRLLGFWKQQEAAPVWILNPAKAEIPATASQGRVHFLRVSAGSVWESITLVNNTPANNSLANVRQE